MNEPRIPADRSFSTANHWPGRSPVQSSVSKYASLIKGMPDGFDGEVRYSHSALTSLAFVLK